MTLGQCPPDIEILILRATKQQHKHKRSSQKHQWQNTNWPKMLPYTNIE